MRLLLATLFAALAIVPAAQAQDAASRPTRANPTQEGNIISIPGSDVKVELGKETTATSAAWSKDGSLVITLVSTSPGSGFKVIGLPIDQVTVMFTLKGAAQGEAISPGLKAEKAYTFIPVPVDGAADGGTFIITMLPPIR